MTLWVHSWVDVTKRVMDVEKKDMRLVGVREEEAGRGRSEIEANDRGDPTSEGSSQKEQKKMTNVQKGIVTRRLYNNCDRPYTGLEQLVSINHSTTEHCMGRRC